MVERDARWNRARLAASALVPAVVALAGLTLSEGQTTPPREPVVGGPCEGCEAVFEGLPGELSWTARLAPPGEPGEPLRIEGRVVHPDGRPAPGTILYAYHTNIEGVYPKDESLRGTAADRHGALRGWAAADANGRYRFETVRPGGYPGSSIPQHVHMHVIEPGCCTYYIDDVVFTDDPRLTPDRLAHYTRGRGGPGVATPTRDDDGTLVVVRDVVIGKGVPGHPSTDR